MSSATDMLKYYRSMLVIRLFEEKVEELFSKGLLKGTTHTSVGQEAVAVGVCAALNRQDCITSTHRGHGHFIARGGDPRRIMAEIFGKETGYSRGRGGSQFMADFKMGFLGANGITGGSLPIATGAALSLKLRRTGQVAVCFFGDGAASQGTFHESLNMAAIWKLPVVFVCENNLYAMSTPVSETIPIRNIADRAAGYGFPGVVVDGNDPLAVRDAMSAACERARELEGPTLIEAKTYRFSGHSRGDPRRYRSPEEEATWRKRDPILRFAEYLREQKLMSPKQDAAVRKQAKKTVADAVAFATKSKFPDVSTMEEGVFA